MNCGIPRPMTIGSAFASLQTGAFLSATPIKHGGQQQSVARPSNLHNSPARGFQH
jgi:hypothetical protein|tara:strand:- start:465 stop:629 length:165 start_codon:yes stop_codon:yes gene_type:complete